MSQVLAGKVALITGGGRGVGAAVADEFINEGAKVVVTDVDDDLVAAANRRLADNGFAVCADVRDAERMRSVCEQAVERFGSLDAVVANAGVGSSAKLGSITEEQFDFIFGVNVKGSLNTVQAALPHLTSGSTVVLIGSTAEIQAVEAMSLYAGSKAALRAMVRTWVKDTAHSGVRINMLSLGAVDTPSLRNALEGASGADAVDRIVKQMGEDNPLGRLAQPDEVARAVVFLSSSASSFILGAQIWADGGMAQVG